MKNNIGNADRVGRLLVAVVIGALYLNGNIAGILSYILLAVGAIFALTAIVGSCPLYSLFGINTCGTAKSNKPGNK
jgi:hypothetical protein